MLEVLATGLVGSGVGDGEDWNLTRLEGADGVAE